MNAVPPDFDPASRAASPSPLGRDDSAIDRQWEVLREAGLAVAALVSPSLAPAPVESLDFPPALTTAKGWRKVMIEQGLSDLIAMMEPGLSALLEVHGRGGDASAPALALWQEFSKARLALVALAPPPEDEPAA